MSKTSLKLVTENKRSEERVMLDHNECCVQYQFINLAGKKVEQVSQAKDVSLSGIKMLCYEAISINQTLNIKVAMPGKQDLCRLFAEVRWCLVHEDMNAYLIGLKLIRSLSLDWPMWNQFINTEHFKI